MSSTVVAVKVVNPSSTTHSSLLFYKATLTITNLYGDSSEHFHGGSTTGTCTLLLLLHWLGLQACVCVCQCECVWMGVNP